MSFVLLIFPKENKTILLDCLYPKSKTTIIFHPESCPYLLKETQFFAITRTFGLQITILQI
jgi:hypothetical protein